MPASRQQPARSHTRPTNYRDIVAAQPPPPGEAGGQSARRSANSPSWGSSQTRLQRVRQPSKRSRSLLHFTPSKLKRAPEAETSRLLPCPQLRTYKNAQQWTPLKRSPTSVGLDRPKESDPLSRAGERGSATSNSERRGKTGLGGFHPTTTTESKMERPKASTPPMKKHIQYNHQLASSKPTQIPTTCAPSSQSSSSQHSQAAQATHPTNHNSPRCESKVYNTRPTAQPQHAPSSQ